MTHASDLIVGDFSCHFCPLGTRNPLLIEVGVSVSIPLQNLCFCSPWWPGFHLVYTNSVISPCSLELCVLDFVHTYSRPTRGLELSHTKLSNDTYLACGCWRQTTVRTHKKISTMKPALLSGCGGLSHILGTFLLLPQFPLGDTYKQHLMMYIQYSCMHARGGD